MWSGSGSVGEAVASNTRGSWFESSHELNFIPYLVLTVDKTQMKRGWDQPTKKTELN